MNERDLMGRLVHVPLEVASTSAIDEEIARLDLELERIEFERARLKSLILDLEYKKLRRLESRGYQ